MKTQFLNTKAGMVVAAGATVLVLAYIVEKKLDRQVQISLMQ